ncbi:MAG: transposase [Deferribacteraceae bacterium]|nr:transposase [Deferribacteraceae bacterium]
MSAIREQYSEEFKSNAVKLSYASSSSVSEVAGDLGISASLLSCWRSKYSKNGGLSKSADLEEELKDLRLKNADLTASKS